MAAWLVPVPAVCRRARRQGEASTHSGGESGAREGGAAAAHELAQGLPATAIVGYLSFEFMYAHGVRSQSTSILVFFSLGQRAKVVMRAHFVALALGTGTWLVGHAIFYLSFCFSVFCALCAVPVRVLLLSGCMSRSPQCRGLSEYEPPSPKTS
eukprot:scaffold4913_cov111-Isochrysis_galbana.AAC.3